MAERNQSYMNEIKLSMEPVLRISRCDIHIFICIYGNSEYRVGSLNVYIDHLNSAPMPSMKTALEVTHIQAPGYIYDSGIYREGPK